LIIWLNGNFAAGKTSTAEALHAMWPGSLLLDPEVIGVALRAVTPGDALVRDFQDIQLWRELVVATCAGLVAEWGRPVIVPMTLLQPTYFREVVTRLRDDGLEVHHFCLTAPVTVLRARARQRAEEGQHGSDLTWLEERWAAYDASDPRFAEHIDTTTASARDIAVAVAAMMPQPLPSNVGTARWTVWRSHAG
jgi:predicted kinase